MNLSNRMGKLSGEGAFEVLVRAQALERQGRSIIHLEIGQPNFATPDHIVDAAIKALHEGKTKYVAPLGIPELRAAIAEDFRKTRGIRIAMDNVLVTPSPKTAIFVAMQATLEPGDEVIYPNPGFPTYEILIRYFGGTPKPVPLLEERGFSFDLNAFEKLLSPKTKMVILNSPSNPTGGVMPHEDFVAIALLLSRYPSCWILSDEIYAKILYDNIQHESIMGLPNMAQRTLVIDGCSKAYAMTGWRLGHLIFPSEFRDPMNYLATHMFSCTSSFSQYAALAAYEGTQEPLHHMVGEFQKRRDCIIPLLNEIPGMRCHMPQGAFYAFPNVQSFHKPSAELAQFLLDTAGVALLGGTAFGEYGEGYLRLSYANSLENIEEGIRRIKSALAKP